MKFADGQELVDVAVDELVRMLERSVIVKKDGQEYFIGKGAIDNLDDVEDAFKRKTVCDVTVPKWLAKQNEWPEGDD